MKHKLAKPKIFHIMYKSLKCDTYYPCKYLRRFLCGCEGRLVGMDNTKKHNTDTANTKKSDRTAFADELNMDATNNNKNKQNHNK